MSAISSQLSFRSSAPWNFNPRVFNLMDSIYAIAFGLGLRTLVDAVSQDLKLTGSLIGLWEGVITLHFLKKMPKSSDPYIAYGVRLFVDFLVTESMERLVLVLIWSAFGLVLADVTPAIWDEVGLNRVWRHFRRDLYTIYDKIPTVAFFPPQRTVRFLPPRERQRERELEPGEFSPSIAASQDTPTIALVVPPSPSPSVEPSEPLLLKHRVPGYYYSDTETDFGSINRSRNSPRTEANDTIISDLDEGNQSSAGSSPSLNHDEILHDEIPHDEIPDMEEMLIDVGIEEVDPAPKQKAFPWPPTPSDSAARLDTHRDDVLHAKPLLQYTLPNILDSVEDGGTSSDGWEKIHPKDLDEERSSSPTPPTPPAKDKPIDGGGLSIEIPAVLSAIPTENRRESLPPAYTSHVDDGFEDIDMYCEPEKPTATTTADDQANVNNEHVKNNDDDDNNDLSARQSGDFDIDTGVSDNPWHVRTPSDVAASEADAAKMQAEEAAAERVRKEEVEAEAERIQKKAENERIRREEDERKRQEAEETKRKEAEYERIRKEAEDERSRQEAEDERIRKEAEELRKETERKRKADELAERKKKEEADAALRKQKQEEAKRQEAAEQKRKDEEAAKKKEAEEAERKKKDEEAAKKKEDEEAERKRKEDEEAERKRKEEEAAKKEEDEETERKRKAEEDAEQRRKDEDALKKKMEEDAERKRQDEDALKKKKEEEQEVAKKKKEAEEQEAREIEKQRQDEAATHAQNGDTPGDQATEEKEDDSKTVHGVDIYGAQLQQGRSETDDIQNSTTPPRGDYTEEESVISAATTDPPQEAKVRLERMMILRAQMIEVEKRLDDLKGRGFDETSMEVKAAEKSLKKFRRQADRRYNAGIQLAGYSEGPSDNIFLSPTDPPQMAVVKIEENLEQLLTPTTCSIFFKLTFASNTSAKKLKSAVLKILMTYNLLSYTSENERNKKESKIEIPEGKFPEWLIEYRASVARRNAEDEF